MTEDCCVVSAGGGAECRLLAAELEDTVVSLSALSLFFDTDAFWRCFFELLSPLRSPDGAAEFLALAHLYNAQHIHKQALL